MDSFLRSPYLDIYSLHFLFHKSEKIEETITNIPINEEKLRLINNDNNKSPNIINKEELKNIKQENLNNSSFSEEFDNNNINLEKPYKANHKKIFLPLSDQVLNFISFFCLFSFFILYLFDLFAYGFAFYKDSYRNFVHHNYNNDYLFHIFLFFYYLRYYYYYLINKNCCYY